MRNVASYEFLKRHAPPRAWRTVCRTLRSVSCGILFLVFAAVSAGAQESSSLATTPAPVTAGGVYGALSEALTAACSQSQTGFAKFLTARNQEAFARMTPAARIALMKRFVLLSQPGKPTVTLNPSGRPTVRCETPDGAAEIQVGGADAADNVAFLPVELRDATDLAGADLVRTNIGLVREENHWCLLSVGLLLLDLPALEVEWNAEEIGANEAAALETLRQVAEAIEEYRRTYTRLPDSLAKLGPPPPSPTGKTKAKPTPDAADLLSPDLAGGLKDGYAYRYVILGASTLGAMAQYELAASPSPYGVTGRRSFFRDAAGAIHAADRKGAVGSASDPKLE
jgi:hypothetical protein